MSSHTPITTPSQFFPPNYPRRLAVLPDYSEPTTTPSGVVPGQALYDTPSPGAELVTASLGRSQRKRKSTELGALWADERTKSRERSDKIRRTKSRKSHKGQKPAKRQKSHAPRKSGSQRRVSSEAEYSFDEESDGGSLDVQSQVMSEDGSRSPTPNVIETPFNRPETPFDRAQVLEDLSRIDQSFDFTTVANADLKEILKALRADQTPSLAAQAEHPEILVLPSTSLNVGGGNHLDHPTVNALSSEPNAGPPLTTKTPTTRNLRGRRIVDSDTDVDAEPEASQYEVDSDIEMAPPDPAAQKTPHPSTEQRHSHSPSPLPASHVRPSSWESLGTTQCSTMRFEPDGGVDEEECIPETPQDRRSIRLPSIAPSQSANIPCAQPPPPPQPARRWPSTSSVSLGQPHATRSPSVRLLPSQLVRQPPSGSSHSKPSHRIAQCGSQKSILSRKAQKGRGRTSSVLRRTGNSVRYLLHPADCTSSSRGSQRLEYIASKVGPLRPRHTIAARPSAPSQSLDAVRAQLARSIEPSVDVLARQRTSVPQPRPSTTAAPSRPTNSTIRTSPLVSVTLPNAQASSSQRPSVPPGDDSEPGPSSRPLAASGLRTRAPPDLLSSNEEERAATVAIAAGKEPPTRKPKACARNINGNERQIVTVAKKQLYAVLIVEDPFPTRGTCMCVSRAVFEVTWEEELPDVAFEPPSTEAIQIMANSVPTNRGRTKEAIRQTVQYRYDLKKPAADQGTIDHNLGVIARVYPNLFHCLRYNPAYGHYESPILTETIAVALFNGPTSIGVVYRSYFEPMPLTAVAFVLANMQFCLEEWEHGYFQARDLSTNSMLGKYVCHYNGLKAAAAAAPARMARLQRHWFEYGLDYSGATIEEEPPVQAVTLRSDIRPDTPSPVPSQPPSPALSKSPSPVPSESPSPAASRSPSPLPFNEFETDENGRYTARAKGKGRANH